MAGTTGLEPATSDVTGRRSNQLSYVPASSHVPSNRTTPRASAQIRCYQKAFGNARHVCIVYRSMLISRSVFPTLLLASCFVLFAQVPAKDKRNTDTPDTDTHFPMRTFASLQEWQEHKAQLRQQILAAAGLLPMPRKTPLNPRITGRMERGDHSIENVLIETLPGFYLAGNLYRPLGKKGKFPGVASPHGHWKHGRQENTAQASIPGRAINLARQGYVVFTYDMVGYNDTKQLEHKFGGKTEQLWSFGPLGLQLWNSIRVVDFLQSLNDVDDGRIAVTGASGGATQSFLLTAVDPRITVAAPVNMVSAIMQGGCECENAPGFALEHLQCGDCGDDGSQADAAGCRNRRLDQKCSARRVSRYTENLRAFQETRECRSGADERRP